MKQTVQFVPRFDDLDMAWLYIAQGWRGVKIMPNHHGEYSWLVWK